jgi:hypothetical protein
MACSRVTLDIFLTDSKSLSSCGFYIKTTWSWKEVVIYFLCGIDLGTKAQGSHISRAQTWSALPTESNFVCHAAENDQLISISNY